MALRPVRLIHRFELRAPLGLLAEQRAPIGTLLARAGLSPQLEEPDDGFLPARHLLGFLAAGARYLDREDFSFRSVLRAPASQVGRWGPLLSECWRLRDALRCFCAQLMRDAPFLESGLHYGAEHAWLWRRRELPPKQPIAEIQGYMYTLASMLKIVRMVAGDSWTPPAFRAESPAPDWLLGAGGLEARDVRFGGSVLAIAVPYDLLDLRLPCGPRTETSAAEAHLTLPAHNFVGSLQQALVPLVGATTLSLELGAEIAETSPRTLRRWLAQQETSWRRILDRVHFEACEKRMLDPSGTLANIAHDLGYSDQAHFTRAFRRWTGETPMTYQRRRLCTSTSTKGSRLD
jgi:AraC-like DNA-binding protein